MGVGGEFCCLVVVGGGWENFGYVVWVNLLGCCESKL